MKRPFKDIRPIGPFSQRFTETTGEGKQVIGSSGTPFPNVPKDDLYVIYVLDEQGSRPFKTRDFANNVQRKINARGEFDGYKVDFLKSGISSKKNFKEQAVLVKVQGENLAITETQLQRIEGIIEREVDSVSIKERIYEIPGTNV